EDLLSRGAEPASAGAPFGDWLWPAAAAKDALAAGAGDRWIASWAGPPVISRLDRTVSAPLTRETAGLHCTHKTRKPERGPDGRSIPRAAVSAESGAHSNAWPRRPHQVLPLLSKESLGAQKGLPLTMVLFGHTSLIDRARRAGRMSSLGRNGAPWHY